MANVGPSLALSLLLTVSAATLASAQTTPVQSDGAAKGAPKSGAMMKSGGMMKSDAMMKAAPHPAAKGGKTGGTADHK